MNKDRRNRLDEAVSTLQDTLMVIEDIHAEEEEAYDNLPENLQESERGEQMSEYIDTLDEAIGSLEDVICNLQDIVDG